MKKFNQKHLNSIALNLTECAVCFLTWHKTKIAIMHDYVSIFVVYS